MKDSSGTWSITLSRGFWLCSLALACAISVLGALVLLPESIRAQSNAAGPSSRSRLALDRAEMGYPPSLRRPGGSHNTPSSGVDKPVGASRQGRSSWTLVSSPNPSSGYNSLNAVASVSPNDVWAVGLYCSSGCDTDSEVDSTLIEHYNGTSWSVVPSPNVGSGRSGLNGVTAISKKNVWAVGYYYDAGANYFHTLVEHYDGTQWSVVASPNPGQGNNYLNSIDAISPHDIWAVGNYRATVPGPFVTLTEHWNGNNWTVVSSPNPGPARDQLLGVTALDSDDVWAVGYYNDDTGTGRTLTEHWNGSSWSVIPSPNPGAGWNLLNAVSASRADEDQTGAPSSEGAEVNKHKPPRGKDIWAVGFYCVDVDCTVVQPLIEHYDGAAWSVASSPIPGSVASQYSGVLALSAKNVWAAGSFSSDGSTWTNLMSHYDGKSWSTVSVTSPGTFDNNLRSLTATGPNNVWVVGDYDNGEGVRTQVQHYGGRRD